MKRLEQTCCEGIGSATSGSYGSRELGDKGLGFFYVPQPTPTPGMHADDERMKAFCGKNAVKLGNCALADMCGSHVDVRTLDVHNDWVNDMLTNGA